MSRGYKLTLFGLFLGMSLGFGVLALKSYLSKELVDMLQSEVSAACDCSFAVDSIDISLLRLRARATKPRVLENGRTKLEFQSLVAQFSLAKIRQKRIMLSELRLDDGIAIGITPESATYRFIDQLTAPLPPEKDRPGRWKLKLQRLIMNKARFVQELPESMAIAGTVRGSGVSLEVERDANNEFKLKPKIEQLYLVPSQPPSSSRLWIDYPEIPSSISSVGQVEGELYAKDARFEFNQLHFWQGATSLLANGSMAKNAQRDLDLSIAYTLDSQMFGLNNRQSLLVTGMAQITGNPEKPQAVGSFNLDPQKSAALRISQSINLPLQSATGKWHLLTFPDFLFSLDELLVTATGVEAQLVTPLVYSSGKIDGSAEIRAPNFELAAVKAKNALVSLIVSGEPSQPEILLKGKIGESEYLGINLTNLNLGGTFSKVGSLNFSVSGSSSESSSSTAKKLEISGTINNLSSSEPQAEHIKVNWEQPLTLGKNKAVTLSVRAGLSGALLMEKLIGDVNLLFSQPGPMPTLLEGTGKLQAGKLAIELLSAQKTVRAWATADFNSTDPSANLTLDLKEGALQEYDSELRCAALEARAEYSFLLQQPLNGNGLINIRNLSTGCSPYQISAQTPITVPLKAGVLTIPSLKLTGSESSLKIGGTLSAARGFDLQSQGDLELRALLPLVPSFDDLRGRLQAAVSISGPLSSPQISGSGSISAGELSIESAGISARNINGKLGVQKTQLQLRDCSGTINTGHFDLSGEADLSALEKSFLNLRLNNLLLEPADRANATLSSDLKLSAGETGKPTISGSVFVESAEFEKELDLPGLLRVLSGYLFSSKKAKADTAKLPEIELKIDVRASRNIFVITNWLGAELKADLQVLGSIANPVINGKMETVSGWFGIKDRRFEITSGEILFKPNQSEPELQLVSETYVRSHLGEDVSVILEASGLLASPRIRLSSDRGLSEREIMGLLTAGESQSARTLALGIQRESEFKRAEEDLNLPWLSRFFKNLARIDSLSLEPTFNPQSGLVEPALIAKKRITDEIILIGQNSLAGSSSESKVRLLYSLSPDLTLAGILDSSRNEKNSTLGFDLAYSLLNKSNKLLQVDWTGNQEFSKNDLSKIIRLNQSSRLPIGEHQKIAALLQDFYVRMGFLDAKIEATCLSFAEELCSELSISVNEGTASLIDRIEFRSADLPEFLNAVPWKRVPPGTRALRTYLDEYKSATTNKLRAEGYLGARVNSRYEASADSLNSQLLIIEVEAGQPVSFSFKGNQKFTPAQFLETINLFKRKQPFGNNTINILVQNIERLYRAAGYLYATIQSSRETSPDQQRINYIINIDEGDPVHVSDVIFEGNTHVSAEQIRSLVQERFPNALQNIFSPNVALAEQIDLNVETLLTMYAELGYSGSEIHTLLKPDESGSGVEIHYLINEGEHFAAHRLSLEIRGSAQDQSFTQFTPPQPPRSPFTIPKLNQFIDDVVSRARNQGYFNARVETQILDEGSTFKVILTLGNAIRIGLIAIDPTNSISEEVIVRNLEIQAGDRWESEKIDASKRHLLKLGLFSSVDIQPEDGTLDTDTESVFIKLNQRPLRSLELGSGANSTYGLHIFGEAEDRALFRDGKAFIMRLDSYYDSASANISQGIASVRYADPLFLQSEYSFNSDLRYQKIELSTFEYNYNRLSLASYWNRSWENGFTASAGHTILQENLDDVTPSAVLSDLDQGVVNLSFLSGSFSYDQRDDPFNPSRGYNLSTDYKLALRGIGSDADFASSAAKISYLYPLFGNLQRFSLAFNGQVAGAWTFDGTTQVPITQRFYLGGRNSIRGFRENSLGPRASDGAVLGGDFLVANNNELRYRLADNISLHTFLDIGTVYLRDLGVTSDQLRESIGIGLSYLSPIGPIGLDLGHPLDEKPGEPSIRFHFSVGGSF